MNRSPLSPLAVLAFAAVSTLAVPAMSGQQEEDERYPDSLYPPEFHTCAPLHSLATDGCFKHPNGQRIFLDNGQISREGAPAIAWPNGRLDWLVRNVLHREDGPAVYRDMEGSEEHYEWFLEGMRHRGGGEPAFHDALKDYWVWYVLDMIHRVGGPAYIYGNNTDDGGSRTEEWRQYNVLHNPAGPAIIKSLRGVRFYEAWVVGGVRHRPYEAGPAFTDEFGKKEWWVNGVLYKRMLPNGTVTVNYPYIPQVPPLPPPPAPVPPPEGEDPPAQDSPPIEYDVQPPLSLPP